MSKKEFKKKNIELKKEDLQNVSGGVIAPVTKKEGGYYSNLGDRSIRFNTHQEALEYATAQALKKK